MHDRPRLRQLLVALVALIAGTVGAITLASPASAGCNIPLRGHDNSLTCPKTPDDPPEPLPWMNPQPAPPTTPAPTPQPSLDCQLTGNGAQLFVLPVGLRALWYGFTVEYCYNSNRDLVRVTPRVLLPQIQLPLEELSVGLPVGTIGTVSVTGQFPFLGQITESTAPVLTSQGQTYNGFYTVSLSFVPRGGARQTYESTVGVVINSSFGFPTPPILIRTS